MPFPNRQLGIVSRESSFRVAGRLEPCDGRVTRQTPSGRLSLMLTGLLAGIPRRSDGAGVPQSDLFWGALL